MRLEIRDGAQRVDERTYYDTFDGLLYEAGLSLVHSDDALSLVERDTGTARASMPSAAPPAVPLFVWQLEPGPVRDTLDGLVEVRALLELVHLYANARLIAVLDSEEKTVVRLALEEVRVASTTGEGLLLRPRLRINPVRGYEKMRRRVQATLEHDLGFKPAEEPLVDEAVRASGGIPGGIPSKVELPLRFDQRADAAAAAVLRALLEVIEANLEGVIADLDSEFLHDLRVSVRRSRAVQREFKTVFPPDQLAHFRREFRWLQQATSDARDLDVHVLEFDAMRRLVPEAMRPDLEPLLGVLRARRVRAHRALVRALRSERTSDLLSGWRAFLDQLETQPEAERSEATQPIGAVAGARIGRVYRRMVRMGRAIDEASPPEAYHELRKQGKELRYLLELFGGALYASEVVRPMIKRLKGLQDVLGRHQDREVQAALLRALGAELARAERGEAALIALGALIARLAEDAHAARGEFAGRFAEFAAKPQRRLVKETFA
jgi:CHAD domain-containing protein